MHIMKIGCLENSKNLKRIKIVFRVKKEVSENPSKNAALKPIIFGAFVTQFLHVRKHYFFEGIFYS